MSPSSSNDELLRLSYSLQHRADAREIDIGARHMVERAVIVSHGAKLAFDLPRTPARSNVKSQPAADLLGINPGTLASRIKALGIHKRDSA